MATHTHTPALGKSTHPTTVAGDVDVVLLSIRHDAVEVKHRGTADPLTVNTGRGTADDVTDPTVLGDDLEVIGPGESTIIDIADTGYLDGTVVKLICATAQPYSVTGIDLRVTK